MKNLKFLWLFVSNSYFRVCLRRVLEYAVASHAPQRGSGAADVVFFNGRFGDILFDDQFRDSTSTMRDEIETMMAEKTMEKRVEWTRALQNYWREKGVDIPK